MRCFARLVVDTGDVRRLMGSADFFVPVVLPFFVVGAVDGIGIAVDALSVLSLLIRPRGGVRRNVQGEGREHNDDIDLVAGSLCDVRRRRRQQQDAMSCGGSGDGGGGGNPTFGIGKVVCRPLHSVVGLADQVGEIDGALWVFTSRGNRPEGAMLLLAMDSDPLKFDSEHSIFRGHLEVNRKNFQMAFFPPGMRLLSKTLTTVP